MSKTDRILDQVHHKDRMILYTDTVCGQQTLRDDLWAISTDEIKELREEAERLQGTTPTLPDEPQAAKPIASPRKG